MTGVLALLATVVAVSVAVPVLFSRTWLSDGVPANRFLAIAVPIGLVLSGIACAWLLQAVTAIGVSGVRSSSGPGPTSIAEFLLPRFLGAGIMLLVAELVVCVALSKLMKR
jgi:hypothetical protein